MKESKKYILEKNIRNNFPEKISDVVSRVIKPVYDKDASLINKLKIKWPEIVSEEFAAKTFPSKIISRNEGENKFLTLVLEVYDNSFAALLTYRKSELKEEIATYFGHNIFDEIKLIQKPGKKIIKEIKPLKNQNDSFSDKINEIKDEALKEVLSSLANFIEKDK